MRAPLTRIDPCDNEGTMIIEAFDAALCDPHAVVREEDVQLILTADTRPRAPRESLRALEAAALRAPGHEPGSVVVRPGRPLELLAVIHDLDREPSWTEEWIATATLAALRAARWRGLLHLAMPLPGTVHGRLDARRACAILGDALCADPRARPETLWIRDAGPEAIARLRRMVG